MRFRDTEIEIVPKGNQLKTLALVDKYAEKSKDHLFIVSSIDKYKLDKSKQSLQKIFDAIFRLVYFFPDPQNCQYVRTVNRTLKDRRGNCVDYSVFFSAFLRALGIPHQIQIVEYPNQLTPGISHIYVKTMDGITLDAVIGQDQEGNEINKKSRTGFFNKEILPIKQKIVKKVIPKTYGRN